ncbi:MAG: UDP-glucose/GDP-mannose dehydrogenase family protein, partial [Chloroflexi bacterium]|nr:UDP-glucose/GDP-mannose dehydrogenase family protein [Chloroflexota bacterium]
MGANVSVVGLGKLGCPLAACFASRGNQVIGVDMSARAVDALNDGVVLSYEPGLQELLNDSKGKIRATQDFNEAVDSSDVTFVVVPTPSKEDGTFDNKYVVEACHSIGQGIKSKSSYHIVVIVSTVMPGSTETVIQDALEQSSGKTSGVEFGLCYAPAFVALGNVVQNFLQPDYLLIGESDPRAGEELETLYRTICQANPPVARMNFVNAELVKLANNAFVSTKITFGNMLSHICGRLPDAHVDTVTSALGLDSRIGVKFLKGGLGYGGPCLDRDNVALAAMAQNIGAKAQLAEATDEANRQEVTKLVELIKSKRGTSSSVGVLGLAYKPNTDVIDASQGILLAQALVKEGIDVIAYDPAANDEAKRVLGESVAFADSADQCIRETDVTVLTTPWKAFEELDPNAFTGNGSSNHPKLLIDCWRMLDAA